jgi:uncharacterized protein HemY
VREALRVRARVAHDAPRGALALALAQDQLARILATSTDAGVRRPQKAVELATKATEQAPERGEFWSTLGVACYRAGRWKRAAAALGKATSLKPQPDASDGLMLAMAWQRLGEGAKARSAFESAARWIDAHAPQDTGLQALRREAADLVGAED